MRFRAAALFALTAAALFSCSRSADSSFDRERASLQSRLSASGRLLDTGSPRQGRYAREKTWELEVGGDPDQAKEGLRAHLPADYKLTRDGDREISYVKYDQHDSFYLTLTFHKATEPQSTGVRVLLRTMPD